MLYVIKKILFKNFMLLFRSSRWLRGQFTPNGLMLLSVLVLAGVFGIDTRQTNAYQVFSLLFCLFLLAFITARILRGRFSITRQLPEYGTVGEKLRYRLTVRNLDKRQRNNLLVRDELRYQRPEFIDFYHARDPDDRQRNVFDRVIGYPRLVNLIRRKRGADINEKPLESIEPQSSAENELELLPLRRGYIYFNRSIVARTDPLGLCKKNIRVDNPGRLLVLPRCYNVPEILLASSRRYQPGGLNLSISVGDSEEFFSLREYRPGDPVRSIHWRSYARRGEPVIKEYQDEFFSRMGLVLDTCLGDKPAFYFEEAVSVAASIIVSNRQQDALLDLLLVHNQAWRLTSGRGIADAESMLEVLACADYSREDNFSELADLVSLHSDETSGFILLFMHWDSTRQKLVRELRVRNIPVLVMLITESGEVVPATDDPMADRPELFWPLRADDMQTSLDRHFVYEQAITG